MTLLLIVCRHLSLSMNNISALPSSIGRLTTLHNLEVSDNQLRDVPTSIGALRSLSSLSMRSNHLALLPETVGELAALTFLDVSLNDIKVWGGYCMVPATLLVGCTAQPCSWEMSSLGCLSHCGLSVHARCAGSLLDLYGLL